jgi:hypothetical protein
VFLVIDAEFRNTGLERSEKLAKDLEWFKEQGHTIPEPSSPGVKYAQCLKELSEKDPQAFLCHFYNVYFAHTAGGRMIGKKVNKDHLRKCVYRNILCHGLCPVDSGPHAACVQELMCAFRAFFDMQF